jgi:hypothetical protein
MPFTGNFTCNSFKSGLIDGDFDFDTDTFKIALYTNSCEFKRRDRCVYTTAVKLSGSGYTAGGNALTVSKGHYRRYGFYNFCRYFVVCRHYGSWCVDL